jgi:SNF2 family DNA or RNA helicase
MTVEATLEDHPTKPRILIRWSGNDFAQHLSDLKANVSGVRFRKSDKVWTAPATVDTCHSLRRAFGEDLKIKKPLAQWYIDNKAARDAQEAASVAGDAELALLPSAAPRLAATLRPDQRAGVAWVAQGYRGGGLVADVPGLGKTLETIGGIIEADVQGRVIIVCPKISVFNVWHHELKRWTDETVVMARGTKLQRQRAIDEFFRLDDEREDSGGGGRTWLIVVAEMLRVERRELEDGEVKSHAKNRGRIEGYAFPELFDQPWSAIILDESQRLLGSLSVAKSNLAGEGLVKLPLTPQGRKYALSGTPFGKGGRVQGMFGTLHWIWPDEYTSFWKWAERHFEVEEKVINRAGKTAKQVSGLRNGVGAEEFLASLGPRILRRTKAEVLPNLPPKQYADVWCEMSPAQKKQYKQLADDAEIALPGGFLTADGVLAEITRARQIANGCIDVRRDGSVYFKGDSCKIDALLEKLEGRDGSGTKVVVASRFNEFLSEAETRLAEADLHYLKITGATSEKNRNSYMAEFQAPGGPTIMLINTKAAGISINLDAADEMHMLDELDNPEDNEQAEDRIHRASRMHKVTIYYYRTIGTYDEAIQDRVENKRIDQHLVLDGRRGVDYVRSLIKYKEPTKEQP